MQERFYDNGGLTALPCATISLSRLPSLSFLFVYISRRWCAPLWRDCHQTPPNPSLSRLFATFAKNQKQKENAAATVGFLAHPVSVSAKHTQWAQGPPCTVSFERCDIYRSCVSHHGCARLNDIVKIHYSRRSNDDRRCQPNCQATFVALKASPTNAPKRKVFGRRRNT